MTAFQQATITYSKVMSELYRAGVSINAPLMALNNSKNVQIAVGQKQIQRNAWKLQLFTDS